MTLKFFFGGERKDGTAALRIRFKAGEVHDRKITIEGLAIQKKLWDKSLNRVLPSHPGYHDINDKISKYEAKMRDVSEKFRVGNISFNTACRMMESSSQMTSLKEFISQLDQIDDKSRQTKTNYLASVNSFSYHTGIKDPLFSEVTYLNFSKMRKSISEKGKSPETHNKYLRDIKAICRLAFRLKIIFDLPEFDSTWRAKSTRAKKLKTTNPKTIFEAIDRIELHSKNENSRHKTVKQFESIGLWLLMFSMRGMYPADINEISVKNLDYDFKSRIEAELEKSNGGKVSIEGNPFIYRHARHKTDVPMNIMLNMPPIRKLIQVMRYMVSASHPKDAFQTREESKMDNKTDRIKARPVEEVDNIKIFSFTEDSNPSRHKQMWNYYSKQLKNLGMPSFKIARKTFMTTATLLDIPQSIGRTMLGQTDPSISAYYNNFDDPRLFIKITQAHIKVLKDFEVIELFNFWLNKVDSVFGSNLFDIYSFRHDASLIYKEFNSHLEEMIKIRSVNI
mgnify:CR=1 FL=1